MKSINSGEKKGTTQNTASAKAAGARFASVLLPERFAFAFPFGPLRRGDRRTRENIASAAGLPVTGLLQSAIGVAVLPENRRLKVSLLRHAASRTRMRHFSCKRHLAYRIYRRYYTAPFILCQPFFLMFIRYLQLKRRRAVKILQICELSHKSVFLSLSLSLH